MLEVFATPAPEGEGTANPQHAVYGREDTVAVFVAGREVGQVKVHHLLT